MTPCSMVHKYRSKGLSPTAVTSVYTVKIVRMTLKGNVPPEAGTPLGGLHSARSTLRLEQIARLRAIGIGNHIALPQLLVCGDQSAGKSSVLEGLTGIPFPRKDGFCTKFPTEILLQHSPGERIIDASILPSPDRPDGDERRALTGFSRRLHGFDDLPVMIEEVGRLMGIRDADGNKVGPAFGADVLRIVVQGNVGLHLSIVNVPGLIAVPNEEQTDDDVQTIHRLFDGYISNPRTIILAVVQAGNDIANQSIITKSRQFDPDGERTVGIITKPDLINQSSEKRIAFLASNKDTTKLKLGFFLVKNPAPNDLTKDITPEQRQRTRSSTFTLLRGKSSHSILSAAASSPYASTSRRFSIGMSRKNCRMCERMSANCFKNPRRTLPPWARSATALPRCACS